MASQALQRERRISLATAARGGMTRLHSSSVSIRAATLDALVERMLGAPPALPTAQLHGSPSYRLGQACPAAVPSQRLSWRQALSATPAPAAAICHGAVPCSARARTPRPAVESLSTPSNGRFPERLRSIP